MILRQVNVTWQSVAEVCQGSGLNYQRGNWLQFETLTSVTAAVTRYVSVPAGGDPAGRIGCPL